ncbi:ATP-binding protein [Paucibacter sp. APW11]|uniref:histidine kinase n=1 Tax=Roseateles aquae TaxID=3077235 RepID=A0ABU3PIV5_9BURK|nr:ATP-binding protein [Paucibacter sp. APW11]MDT9002375.1 ATP-binding protein [Paucibacter sp. APW11]
MSSSGAAAASKSLFRRALLAFYAVVLGAWLAMLISEIYDVKIVQARNGQAWNQVWAEHVRLQARLWSDQPERLQQVLAELERLRAQEWQQMGYDPPTILLQLWQHERLIHRFASADIGRRPPPDQAQKASDGVWLYVELGDAERGLRVRRWQEVPGDWHLGLNGLAYYARPLFYSVPLVMGLAWLLLRRGFRPLRRIGRQIAQRPAQDLAPLPASDYVELAPVVDGVNSLLSQLREHQQRERDFLLDAAHELKTPLAVIQLNAEILGQARPDTARAQEARQRLDEGVKRATHTVHQLLSLSRSAAGTSALERREQDLVTLCRDRLVLASQLALRRDIELELIAPEQAWLPLHREAMASLIDNLLDNAIKYAPDGSLLQVSITSGSEALTLSVSDQGPGIPAALRGRVFERFYRLPGQEQPGSGLGLAIVERAAALHGATLTLGDADPAAPEGRRGLRVDVRFGLPPAA